MLSYLALGVLPLAAVTGYYAYKFHPDVLLNAYVRCQFFRQRFKIRNISTERRLFCYAHRESWDPSSGRPTLVFLHGFSASKDMWLWVTFFLPKDVEVFLLDLPGHGGTTTFDEDDLGVEGQADTVKEFFSLAGLERSRVHLCGISMGGAIAGVFANKYSHLVEMVTLICPAMRTPTPSPFQEAILNEGSVEDWLLPQTPEQMQQMINAVTYHRRQLSPGMLRAVLYTRLAKDAFYHRLWERIMDNMRDQDEHMAKFGKVRIPAQLIWGAEDAIVHPSGIELLKEMNPEARVDLVPDAGHSIGMERPRAVVHLILQFQDSVLKEMGKME